jgi:hypothetical protein
LVRSMNFEGLHYAIFSILLLLFPPLRTHNFFSTIFSETLSLCFPPDVRYKISHPNKTTGNIIVLNILILIFIIQ